MLVWTAILTINASTMLVAWWRKPWSAVQVFTGVPENHYTMAQRLTSTVTRCESSLQSGYDLRTHALATPKQCKGQ